MIPYDIYVVLYLDVQVRMLGLLHAKVVSAGVMAAGIEIVVTEVEMIVVQVIAIEVVSALLVRHFAQFLLCGIVGLGLLQSSARPRVNLALVGYIRVEPGANVKVYELVHTSPVHNSYLVG